MPSNLTIFMDAHDILLGPLDIRGCQLLLGQAKLLPDLGKTLSPSDPSVVHHALPYHVDGL
jgi:hypothetical protein